MPPVFRPVNGETQSLIQCLKMDAYCIDFIVIDGYLQGAYFARLMRSSWRKAANPAPERENVPTR